MLRISENVGEEPGAELDARRASVTGGCLLVQAVLGSDLGRGGGSLELDAGEQGLRAARKSLDSGMEGTAPFFNTLPDSS